MSSGDDLKVTGFGQYTLRQELFRPCIRGVGLSLSFTEVVILDRNGVHYLSGYMVSVYTFDEKRERFIRGLSVRTQVSFRGSVVPGCGQEEKTARINRAVKVYYHLLTRKKSLTIFSLRTNLPFTSP